MGEPFNRKQPFLKRLGAEICPLAKRALLNLSLAIVVIGTLSGAAEAQKAIGVLCSTASGKIVARAKKCLGAENKVSTSFIESRTTVGDTGATGASGVSGRQVVSSTQNSVTANTLGLTYSVSCPSGSITIGGGCYSHSGFLDVVVLHSYPADGNPNAWVCKFVPYRNESITGNIEKITAYSICVDE